MMRVISKVIEHSSKIKALLLSGLIGATAFTGGVLSDNSADRPQDLFSEEKIQDESPKEISNQIDENAEKLDSLAGANNSETDYRVMGC